MGAGVGMGEERGEAGGVGGVKLCTKMGSGALDGSAMCTVVGTTFGDCAPPLH